MLINKPRHPNVQQQCLAGMAGPRSPQVIYAPAKVRTPCTIAYISLLMIVAITLIRPMDIFPALQGLPLYQVIIAAAVVVNWSGITQQLRFGQLRARPVTTCVFGMYFSIVMSHLTHSYLGGATDIGFIPVLLLYLLVVSLVDTPERFQHFLRFVAVAGCVGVSICLLDYLNLIQVAGITHLSREDEVVGELMSWRMRGVGIFEDPNDLATLIVFVGIICVWAFQTTPRPLAKLLWVLALATLSLALIYTRSRGGLLAAAGAGSVLMFWRYGKTALICTAAGGIALLPILSGRTAGVSDDSTAYERVMLWREGLHAMMSPEFVFGIGAGRYEELDGLVAHNSFIHAFVELGFVGGSCFVGLFWFVVLPMWRAVRRPVECPHPQLAKLFPFVAAFVIGWSVALLSLSRCYAPSTMLVVAIGAAFVNVLERHVNPPQKLVRLDRSHLTTLMGVCVLLLIGFYCFTRAVT